MTLTSNNCCENEITRMNIIIRCQNEKIKSLETKLEFHEEMVSERDSLKKIVGETEEWGEKIEKEKLKLIMEQSETCKLQAEELKKLKTAEMIWKKQYNDLINQNKQLKNEFDDLQLSKNDLQAKLADCEGIKLRVVEDELRTTKSKLEDANAQVNKLKIDLKCYEEQLCSVRRRYDECLKEDKRLNDAKLNLETNLKCTKSQLSEIKHCAARAEEKFKQDQDRMSEELKTKCKQLSCMEDQYNEVSCALNEEKNKVKKLVRTLLEVRDAAEKEHKELLKHVEQMKEKYLPKKDEICSLKNMVEQLRKEKQCAHNEINKQKNQLHDYENKLQQIKSLPKLIRNLHWRIENIEKIFANDNQLNTYSEPNNSTTNGNCTSRNINSIIQKYRTSSDNELNCKCNGIQLEKYVKIFEYLKSDICKTCSNNSCK